MGTNSHYANLLPGRNKIKKWDYYFFIRKLFQSTRLYIEGILGGRPATLCLVESGNVSFFMKFLNIYFKLKLKVIDDKDSI